MSRGIFKNVNGQWKSVVSPSVKKSGTWNGIQKGFVNQNGVWKQFYPGNVLANILVVGGGGGGGIGYGYEGGGGGGAGGVVYQENVLLSAAVGSIYNVTIGVGGGANAPGQNSWFGSGTIPVVASATDIPVYPCTYPVYCSFLNTYGVWTNPDFVSPEGSWVTVNYTANLPAGQNYTLRVSGDNHIRVIIDGQTVGANDNWATSDDSIVSLPAGITTITCSALNDGGPASFAAALYDPSGNAVWSTRDTTYTTTSDWPVAYGGGNGGWGTPEQTAGSGGSGGGGCGYVNTHSGGSGVPGQGNSGGTGIWQGYGAAGGGGGGGFAGAGAQSNGNGGGNGGTGITLLGLSVGGGGGGGYGNQGPDGSGPGGYGGGGGGGFGNGGNGTPWTGGGGGGSMHSAQTKAGIGGSGVVIVQYLGSPVFSGGGDGTSGVIVPTPAGFTTHVFRFSGQLAAL